MENKNLNVYEKFIIEKLEQAPNHNHEFHFLEVEMVFAFKKVRPAGVMAGLAKKGIVEIFEIEKIVNTVHNISRPIKHVRLVGV